MQNTMIFGMLYCYIKIQPRTPYLLRVIAMNALSIDLRQRILNYSLAHPIRQTAEVFQVSPDTVHRLKKLYYETGGVEPRPCQAEHWKAISEEAELYLKAHVMENPDLTLLITYQFLITT